MSMPVFFFVPTILFMTLVAPIWIVMHYRSKNRAVKGLNDEERQSLEELLQLADRLTDRIDALERILDVDAPDWRQHKHQTDK